MQILIIQHILTILYTVFLFWKEICEIMHPGCS